MNLVGGQTFIFLKNIKTRSETSALHSTYFSFPFLFFFFHLVCFLFIFLFVCFFGVCFFAFFYFSFFLRTNLLDFPSEIFG